MPMDSGHLQASAAQNMRLVPVTPTVKSAGTRELFNNGVREFGGSAKSADPTCYTHHRNDRRLSMGTVVKLKRKVRPLSKTYQPNAPYVVAREDQDNGSIAYEIYDERPDSYRYVCATSDDGGGNPYAKHDAEQIARGLNMLVQFGKETLPNVQKFLDRIDADEDE
jgi:hypothetical protein